MAQSIGVLNSIRMNASEDYQNRIPEATRENIATIGNALSTYTVLYNEFCEALLNKIGKTILESKLFTNKLARFKSGAIISQQDVEEIFIEMSKAEGTYDPTGPNPLGRRNPPDVKAVYHRMNRQDYYAISIGDVDFRRVFRSEDTLDTFMAGLINSVYSGASLDEWITTKNLLGSYDGYAEVKCYSEGGLAEMNGLGVILSGSIDEGTAKMSFRPESWEVIAKQFIKSVRKTVQDMSFPSTKFNKAGVTTWSNPEDLVLLVNKDLLAEIDVEVLSKAFNMGKTDIQVEIIPMDDFGSLTDTYGLLVDKDFFRIYDTLSHFEPQRNAQGLFTNYFYHIHQILSLSPFKQAARFVAAHNDLEAIS